MLGPIKSIALAAALVVPAMASAQDQAPAESGETTAVPSDLSTGQPAAPQIVSETFGDWTVNCQQLGENELCQMQQLLLNAEQTPAVEVNIFPVQAESQVFAGGTIVVPLGTLLTANLTVSVDNAIGRVYPFAFCLPEGCVARVGFTEEDISGFKKGAAATVRLADMRAPGQPIDLKMSLSGFTAAFDRLSQ